MARKRRDGSAPQPDKEAGRENKREGEEGEKGEREGRAEAEIYSFTLYWVRWCQPLMNSPVGCCYREGRKNKTLLYEQHAAPRCPQALSSCWINYSTGLEGGQLLIYKALWVIQPSIWALSSPWPTLTGLKPNKPPCLTPQTKKIITTMFIILWEVHRALEELFFFACPSRVTTKQPCSRWHSSASCSFSQI